MPSPPPQPIARLSWRQTPARARRVAQALCLRKGDDVDADELAGALDVPVELIRAYLTAARAERELRNIAPGDCMSSTMIARAMSTNPSGAGDVSSATVRRYLADPCGAHRRSRRRARSTERTSGTALKWPAALVLERILEWRTLYGAWPTGYDWTRAHAARRGGDALARWSTGYWPDAQTVRRIYYTFPLAVAAARRYVRTRGAC